MVELKLIKNIFNYIQMKLLSGDCLELLKELQPKSVDLVFCDLPYGQTNCGWDNKIDLNELWKQLKRVIKTNTPLFFTCSTKFGYELIKSNEKWFRYDLVWEKTAPVGFLCAKKMPMKKHEMIYVFYEKLPFYDISSHKHKFTTREHAPIEGIYGNTPGYTVGTYDPPLPTSVIKDGCLSNTLYGEIEVTKHDNRKDRTSSYDPPLPTSILQFKSEKGKHKTQKPITMMDWILKYYSKENDVVLDPTMGSGSMGIACKEMNREFIGFEKNEDIYKVACNRLDYQIQ